ncbi:sulfatase-like hydrolase/transferase [Halorhabdus sp. BNX81]|uniref:sulfatase-like hydrolase/transferase n=1 Tax=Halorhabdus sp. BNX81 TaxID=2980181 RepID=UPI0023DD6551|nr:sulfatase-like hydrolase/transferase [Halorhabdus sp. BNX81]
MDLPRYRLSHLRSAIRNPKRAFLELNKIYYTKVHGWEGIDIVEEDWDNLIVLDACRYDSFRELNTISGKLEKVHSKGSMTVQFLRENFPDDGYPEIVYVSANPNITWLDAKFHKRIRLWENHTDGDKGVVPPQSVTAESLKYLDQYPNKRVIIHYMQPHYPFIGDFGQSLYERGLIEHRNNGNEFWHQISTREASKQDFKMAYEENLRIVLQEVEKLTENIDGKTIITSDHGNEFGRLGVYGHPSGTFTKGLTEVPWFIINSGVRKTIYSGTATDGPIEQDTQLDDKLEALGYA